MRNPLIGDPVLLVKKWSWFGAVGAKLIGKEVNAVPDVAVVKVTYGSRVVANADPATTNNSKTAHVAFFMIFPLSLGAAFFCGFETKSCASVRSV
jgi:hypothetical protein